MDATRRPLSPHLQVYRWQWTMALSILHRLTGVALSAGVLLLAWWLIAAAAGPAAFSAVQDVIGSWPGRLLLFGWTFALFYHLANGIRHLGWDAGWGFELRTAERTAWIVVAAATALTLVAWAAGYAVMAGCGW